MKKYSLIWLTCSVIIATYIIIFLLTYFFLDKNVATAFISLDFSKKLLLSSLDNISILVILSFLFTALLKQINQENGNQPLSKVYANPTDNVTTGFKKYFHNPEYKNLRIIMIFSITVGLLISLGFFVYLTK